MKTRKQTYFYCDYCKRRSNSIKVIEKHEITCTNRLDRKCGICAKLLKQEQVPLADLLKIIPDVEDFRTEHDCGDPLFGFSHTAFSWNEDALRQSIEAFMPKLIDATNGCPACILAALRQSGLPMWATRDHLSKIEDAIDEARADAAKKG